MLEPVKPEQRLLLINKPHEKNDCQVMPSATDQVDELKGKEDYNATNSL